MMINWQQEVENRKEELFSKLKEFLSIRSVEEEASKEEGAPFGKGVAQALQFILDESKAAGFKTKNLDGFAGHAEMGEGEELIGILCHVDVVPEGTGWTTPPYQPTIRNGRIYARGAVDDKGPTMAALFAARIVKDLGLPLNRRVRLIFGANEETGWKCVEHYFAHEEMPTLGFAPDADFPIIYAEKGIMGIRIHLPIATDHGKNVGKQNESQILLSRFQAGYRSNMVPETAMAELHGSAGQLKEVEEGFLHYCKQFQLEGHAKLTGEQINLQLEGKAAHGSMPELGINAGVMLIHFLKGLNIDDEASRWVNLIDQFFYEDTKGAKLGVAREDEISGALTNNAGVLSYEQGGKNEVQLNLRYPVSYQGGPIFQQVQEVLQAAGAEVELLSDQAPHHVNEDDELVTTLQRVYEEQTGQPAKLIAIGGGTYARVLKRGVAYGPVFPGREDVAHQRDEYIEIDDLLRATAIYAQAIYELAK